VARDAANVLADPAQEVLSLRRRRCPDRLETGAVAPSEPDIGVCATGAGIHMEVKERPMTKLEVRALPVASCHVNETVDCTKCSDELRVCHSPPVGDVDGLVVGQPQARSGTSVPISLFVAAVHPTSFSTCTGAKPFSPDAMAPRSGVVAVSSRASVSARAAAEPRSPTTSRRGGPARSGCSRQRRASCFTSTPRFAPLRTSRGPAPNSSVCAGQYRFTVRYRPLAEKCW